MGHFCVPCAKAIPDQTRARRRAWCICNHVTAGRQPAVHAIQSTNTMAVSPGERLGPYEIVDAIGAGGMGEVYKARDTRLDRVVAVKLCKEQFSERFEREARAVAALNHPNICTLHDVGPNFL